MPRSVHDRGEGVALGPPSFITRVSPVLHQQPRRPVLGEANAPIPDNVDRSRVIDRRTRTRYR